MNPEQLLKQLNVKYAPALFIGHGSPLNAINNSVYSQCWADLGRALSSVKAVLCISAHWLTHGTTLVLGMSAPRTIHDFHGFPPALYEVQFPAPGSPQIASRVQQLLAPLEVKIDTEWGFDHGSWSVLRCMYPAADIPVLQLSIDAQQSPQFHYHLGHVLSALRRQGVMILGSGNVVHNLAQMRTTGEAVAYDWAIEFDQRIAAAIEARDHQALLSFRDWDKELVNSAHPSDEHLLPLFYVLGAMFSEDHIVQFTDTIDHGSLSMRSVLMVH